MLAWVEFSVFLLNKEEGGCLERVGGSDLLSSEIFFKKVLGGLLFIKGKGLDFSNLGHEEVIKIDLMIIRLGRRNMVGFFFEEDLGIVGIFQ